MDNMYAPIILFAYKRIEPLSATVEALRKNYLASHCDLIIFSDAAKDSKDKEAVEHVRKYILELNGFKSVQLHFAETNKGLAKSIIDGVTEVFKYSDRVIVLEDDIVTSPNFLNFMNQSLDAYKAAKEIFSISGYTTPIRLDSNYQFDVYFTNRAFSWGWATWKNRWEKINWSPDVILLHDKKTKELLNKSGSDLLPMLKQLKEQKIDSWAVLWCAHQAIESTLTVYPIVSKALNVGFIEGATHTNQKFNRFSTVLDKNIEKTNFKFDQSPIVNPFYESQFFSPFSFKKKALYKILNSFFKRD